MYVTWSPFKVDKLFNNSAIFPSRVGFKVIFCNGHWNHILPVEGFFNWVKLISKPCVFSQTLRRQEITQNECKQGKIIDKHRCLINTKGYMNILFVMIISIRLLKKCLFTIKDLLYWAIVLMEVAPHWGEPW